MKFKIFLFAGVFLLFSAKVVSQNTVFIGTEEVNTETSFDLSISLDNTDAITAIQFDINFNNDAIELSTGHELTGRGSGHTLGVSAPSTGVIRVIVYSATNASISGNTGDLLILKLRSKTLPGDFVLNYSDIVVSSPAGTSVSTAVQEGSLKVLGPQMNILSTEINFGRVPIGASPNRTVTIQNLGNLPLILSGLSTIVPFSIQESFPFTINANSSRNLTILVDSSNKYNDTVELSFQNNDADPLRKIQKIVLTANVYAVNEIKIGTGSGIINTEIEIPVVFENMEPFTGFQFDITLPAGIEYVPNSLTETGRFDGHSISASLINENTLRFLAYSGTNNNFSGNSGEVFSFKLKPNVSSGNYPLVISDAIISNVTLGNILSDIYNGSIQINSPNLSLNPASISYGNVPITETRETTIRLSNTGSALLTINDVVFAPEELSLDIQLPLNINTGAYKDIHLTFTPQGSGEFSETLSFRHNGSTEQNLLQIQATKFSPNYVMVASQQGYRSETNNFQILLKNNDPVRAVQFDVELPVGFNLDINNVSITNRTAGFTVVASNLSGTNYRVILYSTNNISLDQGDLSIIDLPVFINNDVVLGDYQFNFTNVIISDTNNQNVSSTAPESGTITLVESGIKINPKIYLQGSSLSPVSSGLMNDNLRQNTYLPTTSPYGDALTVDVNVFNSGGSSGTGLSQDDIVDWVWVELRDSSDNTIVVNGKSALLQRDGDVVALDGISDLTMDIASDDYYVVVNHRNHLGIMSVNPIALSSTTAIIDLSSDYTSVLGGTNAVLDIGNGVLATYGGDYDENGQVQNTDLSGIVVLLGGSGYSKADLDMNGEIQNTDITNILNPNMGKGQQYTGGAASLKSTTLVSSKADPGVHYTFKNAQITSENGKDYYEVDVLIESSEDFKLGSGQLYFSYNTEAFGENISVNDKLEYMRPTGYILGEFYSLPAYKDFIQNDNTKSRVSISYQQGVNLGTITANNVIATSKRLFHLKIEYVDVSKSPMISFETGDTYLDQTFTACGPSSFGSLNCTNYQGIQLFNDTFDSSGSQTILAIDNNEILSNSINIYPNPVPDILTIDSKIPIKKVEIYSVLGKKVKEINSEFKSIPIYDLSNGVYLIKIFSDKTYITKKMIKK